MDQVKQSKFLSLVLRHRPETIGLSLGKGGWVPVSELLSALECHGRGMEAEDLFEIVRLSDKKRFTLSADRNLIRAAQGHSVEVELDLPEAEPPESLFHGTAEKNLASIFKSGLLPGRRQQVHLSSDRETARHVGRRHGTPRILAVQSGRMWGQGIKFFQADNGVWLVETVPAEFLSEVKDD